MEITCLILQICVTLGSKTNILFASAVSVLHHIHISHICIHPCQWVFEKQKLTLGTETKPSSQHCILYLGAFIYQLPTRPFRKFTIGCPRDC